MTATGSSGHPGAAVHARGRKARDPKIQELECPNPKCQSCTIGRVDVVPGLSLIACLQDGAIVWEGTTEMDWGAQRAAHQLPRYQCGACGYVSKRLDRFFKKVDKPGVTVSKAR